MFLHSPFFPGLVLVVVIGVASKKPSESHPHQPAYAVSESKQTAPRGHQHHAPYGAPEKQAPPALGLIPTSPIVPKGPKENTVGPVSRYPAQLGAYSAVAPRKVVDTEVRCLKTHMQVLLRFSVPFSGYIYPYQHFTECLLFHGRSSKDATMNLKHGTCGDEENRVLVRDKSYLDPVIEHRLMIQWETDIVCEDDVSVIVRCDRPDDFNKTVQWNFQTQHLRSTLERSQHPGPKMFMEIQRGEGPTAPPLDTNLVYIGDLLTLLFTLTDNVYWFDSNVLACFAVDGGEKSQIDWDTTNNQQVSQQSRVYSGEMTVIESGCSVKPKIFSHFIKEKHTRPNGDLVTLHYAYFKAFRFPTSTKIILQCHVQVCYKICPELPPCSESFHPRTKEEVNKRRRRHVEEAVGEGGHEVDQVNLYRSVEVTSAEEGGEKRVPVAAQTQHSEDCVCAEASMGTTNTVMIVMLCILLLLVMGLVLFIVRGKRNGKYPLTEQK